MTSSADTPAYTVSAIDAMIDASQNESDFSGWLAHVVAAAAKRRGGWDVLERRPGSWEASLVERLIGVEMMLTDTVSDTVSHPFPQAGEAEVRIDGRTVGYGYDGPLTPRTDTDTPED